MIEIKNLDVCYRDVAIIKDMSLTFKEKQMTSVIGPNGCGKSTLLHTLTRLISFQGGEILIDGKSVINYKRKELARKIALLPQFREVPDMSVNAFVSSGRYPYLEFDGKYSDNDKAEAVKALEMMGISHLADRNLRTLSGGERQRAYIALCLSQGADILLFDEPTTYLDITYQFEILSLIKSLTDKTVITVLHDVTHALKYSDTVVLMEGGKIRFSGTPQEVADSGLLDEVFNIKLDKENYTVSPK